MFFSLSKENNTSTIETKHNFQRSLKKTESSVSFHVRNRLDEDAEPKMSRNRTRSQFKTTKTSSNLFGQKKLETIESPIKESR